MVERRNGIHHLSIITNEDRDGTRSKTYQGRLFLGPDERVYLKDPQGSDLLIFEPPAVLPDGTVAFKFPEEWLEILKLKEEMKREVQVTVSKDPQGKPSGYQMSYINPETKTIETLHSQEVVNDKDQAIWRLEPEE